jgi:tetratricopeptide (TPR) repeat protein
MDALQEIVEGFGGTVPQVMGDGFMAVFGVPVAHEDDAERAVRAALAVRDHVQELNEERTGAFPLPDVHAGVNTGEVMVAHAHEPAGFAVVGDVVNTASRIEGLARARQVLVGERTRDLTVHAIRYGPSRRLRAKGKAEGIMVSEALGATPGAPGARAPEERRPFVGRAMALEWLNDALASAVRDGSARVLVVSGEPGLGKSRLAEEWGHRLRGVTVFKGRCPPYGRRLPLSPLAEVVGETAGLRPEAADPAHARAAVGRLSRRMAGGGELRSLSLGLEVLLGIESARPGSDGGPSGRSPARPTGSVEDAARAARAVLEGLARFSPVVGVLDDLHLADDDLIEVLERVTAEPWAGPILLLGLARDEPSDRLLRLPRRELGAMGEGELRALAYEILGFGAPEEHLDRLVARAGGNPLFLEESVRFLTEARALVPEGPRWRVADPKRLAGVPHSIRLLIAARLDALPHEEKLVLQGASVAGDVTWDRLMERLSEVRTTPAALRRLEDRGLLVRRPASRVPGAREYAFAHQLIRDVAYESLPRVDRAARHLDVAGWLREITTEPTPETIAVLGEQYEQAWELSRSRTGPSPSPEVARLTVEYLGRWADQVFASQARLAASLYDRAIRVWRASPEDVPAVAAAGLLIGKAECLLELGHARDAREEAEQARALAVGAESAPLEARALLSLGRAVSDLGEVEPARQLLEHARAHFQSEGDARGQALALHHLSETWSYEDRSQELDHLRRAHGLFAGVGDRWGQAMVAQDLAYLLTTRGGAEFDRWYQEARRLADELGDLRSRASVLRTGGYVAYYRGQFEEAIMAMREARPVAGEAGHRYAEADAIQIEAMAAGEVRPAWEAEALAAAVVEEARATGSTRIRVLGLLAGVRPALREGRPSLANRRLRTARSLLVELGATAEVAEVDLAEAAMNLDRGAWGRVEEPTRSAEEAVRGIGWRLYEPRAALLRGGSYLGARRLDAATDELERAVRLAEEMDAPGLLAVGRAQLTQVGLLKGAARPSARGRVQGPAGSGVGIPLQAMQAENRGLDALRRGDPVQGVELLGQAVTRWGSLGLTAWLARAHAMQAAALRKAGMGRSGGAAIRRAREVLDALATPVRDRPSILELAELALEGR